MAKNNKVDLISNEIDTIPRSVAATGTITSANNRLIVGSSTLFTTELQEGDWIFISGQSEVQKVVNIVSNTELVLQDAFTTPLSASAFKSVPKNQYTMISWLIDTAGTAEIDGNVFPASASATVENFTVRDGRASLVDPIVMDTTTNSNVIYVQTKTH